MRLPRVSFDYIGIEPRDAWVGLFWTRARYAPADFLVYVCPVPFVVLRFSIEVRR